MIRFLRACLSSDRLSHSPVTFPARLSFIHPSTIPSCTLSIHLYSYIYFCLPTSPYLSISHYLCHPVYVLYICVLQSIFHLSVYNLYVSLSLSIIISVSQCKYLSISLCLCLSVFPSTYLSLPKKSTCLIFHGEGDNCWTSEP